MAQAGVASAPTRNGEGSTGASKIDTTPSKAGEEGSELITDLSNSDVVTKYRTASDIVNKALKDVVAACQPGKTVLELCKMGDALIEQATAPLYNAKKAGKKKIEKGVALPTTVSVNELCGHVSPLPDDNYPPLKAGDVVKVDMGAHIDGYICVAAHTIVLPEEGGDPIISGKKADVTKAAWLAGEAALRKFIVNESSIEVSKVIAGVAKEFNCQAGLGVYSHQMKRFILDGNKTISQRPDHPEDKVEKFTFGVNEVYAIDIVMSSGEGKFKESEKKTSIYKRLIENTYSLKTQLARTFITDVNKRFPSLPFTLRSFEDARGMRVGVNECCRHALLQPYPVLTEKAGEITAQFKFTVLLLPSGARKISGLPLTQDLKSEYEIKDEGLKDLLASSVNPKKKKKEEKTATANGASPTNGTSS